MRLLEWFAGQSPTERGAKPRLRRETRPRPVSTSNEFKFFVSPPPSLSLRMAKKEDRSDWCAVESDIDGSLLGRIIKPAASAYSFFQKEAMESGLGSQLDFGERQRAVAEAVNIHGLECVVKIKNTWVIFLLPFFCAFCTSGGPCRSRSVSALMTLPPATGSVSRQNTR